ncbi:MAG TPA: hypothetical protein VF666_11205 [Pyrinomonadaceae bacterium]
MSLLDYRATPQSDAELIKQSSFAPDKDKALFYSGRGNKSLAQEAVRRDGLQTIEATEGGKRLDTPGRHPFYGKEAAIELWDEASRKFARAAEGKITTCVAGAPTEGTFRRVELKEILNNPKITEINGVSAETFRQAYLVGQGAGKGIDAERRGLDNAFASIVKAEEKYHAPARASQGRGTQTPEPEKNLVVAASAKTKTEPARIKVDRVGAGAKERAELVNRLKAYERACRARVEQTPQKQRDRGRQYE